MSWAATRDFHFRNLGSDRGLAQNTVTAFAQDAEGFVWVGTQGGLHRYDGQRYHLFRHDPRDPASLPDSYVTALAVEGRDALWVGTYSEFVARLDLRDGQIKRFAIDGGSRAAGLAAQAGARDLAGRRKTVGRHAGRAAALRSEDRAQHRPADARIRAWSRPRPATALLRDRDGAVWFGQRPAACIASARRRRRTHRRGHGACDSRSIAMDACGSAARWPVPAARRRPRLLTRVARRGG
jgi:ligand-binding sensor domain-containing protein